MITLALAILLAVALFLMISQRRKVAEAAKSAARSTAAVAKAVVPRSAPPPPPDGLIGLRAWAEVIAALNDGWRTGDWRGAQVSVAPPLLSWWQQQRESNPEPTPFGFTRIEPTPLPGGGVELVVCVQGGPWPGQQRWTFTRSSAGGWVLSQMQPQA